MTDDPAGQPPRAPAENPILVVGLTTAIQAMTSYGLLSLPVASVFYAADFGLPAWIVGVQISGIYCVALFSSLIASNMVRRLGGGRTSQIALLAMALGVACIASGLGALLLPGLVLMGLSYGLPNPAASHLLRRFTPPARRNLLFSIKQAGVPIGGAMGGIVTAWIAHHVNWQAALCLPALLSLTLGVVLQLVHKGWDDDRQRDQRVLQAPLRDLIRVFGFPRFKAIFASGMLLAAAQLCVSTFIVLLLVVDLQIDPITAGAGLSLLQIAGILGRISTGALADFFRSGLRVLIWLALALAATTLVLVLTPAPSALLLTALLIVIGLLSSGWSGVLIAEADRCAPPAYASAATAALMCGTFFGVMISTTAFAGIVQLFGTYRTPFAMIAMGCIVAAGLLRIAYRADINDKEV
ncbi:MFS transporter [Ketogulonicigenium vulgare]|uniref:Major facilitator family transporter n=1 Tax=Ketogulonicigenium vulgare (strain WSH-001) TaxID=759362 RepID=F9Y9N1_KETVW|nr:MFS transporter [Ketogulonicigenium vulgare]ADO41342.1 major facilitator family transporter [Ketogulonicigenium vulgare Y25]AEM41369.1 Major facilitator family transporter [Ketogulonicigenium vulgare WSH-001]ALJ81508.1 MFS transporter [Ketogulonicigenium vulgare]ANW34216.1 MFS transporter [Ketogulonicigenium vulgare]AOZ55114.1 major facilitator family transporter [Ketogulonicigenium vulgare]